MNPTGPDPATVYGKEYYDRMCAVPYDADQPVWIQHFETLAHTLVERYKPRTVLDVGCAKGFLVTHLRHLGVEAFGVDVSPYAVSQVPEHIRPFCRVAGGSEPLTGQFDLITCIEVAEHMPELEARQMIEEICRHTDQVIFSSTPSDFSEPTHVNVQPTGYWSELFRKQGLFADRHFEPGFITPQAMRFLRCKTPSLNVAVFSHEPPNCAVALLRLAGTIRHLEGQGRMRLDWSTARDPKLDLERFLDSDLFVVHREFADRRICPQVLAAARELNRPIVFELDDLLTNVPHSNPNHKYCSTITPDVLAMLREADFITVTTEPLGRYLAEAEPEAKGKVHVLPNYINLEIWDGAQPPAPEPSEPFVIGWFGTATHDEDLAIIKPAIVHLARKYAGRLIFKFWGYLPKDLEGLPGVQLVRGSQPDLRLHARDLVNCRIDLAVAPLLDHPFNHAKSDLKWLEYSICYIPAIFSTISPYTGSVEHGKTGWLVDNQTDTWIEAIELLMRDHVLRRTIAIQAHDKVRQSRCVNVGAEHWDALYRSFQVSGRRPRPPVMEKSVTRDRAGAHLLLYQADALSGKGQTGQAAELCEQAVQKYLAQDSGVGCLVNAALGRYRSALSDLQQTAELSAQLNAARAVVEAGVTKTAIRLYLDALESVHKTQNPLIVFKTILDVARAFRTLDRERGQQLVQLAGQLARSIRSQEALHAVERLGEEYQSKTAPIPPGPQPKPPTSRAQAAAPARHTRPAATGAATTAPLVSIIIPVYNNQSLTQGCLESLARTPSKATFEVIVVDNASSDGTAQWLQGQEGSGAIRLVTNSRNEGFARGCNQGAQVARSSLLLFLNNDTTVTPGWLDALVQAVQPSQVGIVGAKLLYADGRIQHAGVGFINGMPDHPHRYAAANAPEVNQLCELDMVTGACLLIRRQLFVELGGFDEVYRNGVEDIDLCLRARNAGKKVIYQPGSVVYHLEGQSAGRFDHVTTNLEIFFGRWANCFDQQMRFRSPKKAVVKKAQQSLLLQPGPTAPGTQGPIRLVWEGSFLDYGSLSHVNRELTRELAGSPGVQLTRVGSNTVAPNQIPDTTLESLSAQIQRTCPVGTQITVRHGWPPNWQRPASGKLVVIQPWEYGSLPMDWVQNSSNVDEFWVPTNYVRQVYRDSGIPAEKVTVVPNGVDASLFHPGATPRALATNKKFKFLFVGGTIHRKGPDLLLQAFLNTFSASDDVCLVIKDFGNKSCYAGQTMEQQIDSARRRPNAPEILYLTEELPPESLPGLYTACDCLAYPYRGEGFGLPILEAMACGLPVILTGGGAADDFAIPTLTYHIRADKTFIGSEISGMPLAGQGWLLTPDSQDLAEKMKWVFEHQADARAKGAEASVHVRREWTWEKAAKIAAVRLQELAQTSSKKPAPSENKTPRISLPPCALLGHLGTARQRFERKQPREAWEETIAALKLRPFHPEAFLLLAEIAYYTGDGQTARQCAEQARRMAPGWKPARQFLNRRFKGNTRPAWLVPPPEIQGDKSPSRARLSICLIVKNEEQFLRQCLASVNGLADQTVVVDTGSTDRTVAIAKECGAEVHTFTWCDDFSAARNAALEHARGDWVLMLDADEEMSAEGRARLEQHLELSEAIAWRLPLLDSGREAEGCSYVPRLFRNAPGLFYIGRVHEQVFSSIEVRRQEWGLETRLGEARLIHHGYTAEMTRDRNKIERNRKLLERAIEELPGEPHLLMNLGLELARSGRETEALDRYREAFEAMTGKPAAQITPELRESLLSQFATRLMAAKQFPEIIRVLTSPAAKTGGLTASLHFALGLAQMELGQLPDAAEQMEHCLTKRNRAGLAPINRDIVTAAPFHCLALCQARLGDPAAAEKTFQDGLKETIHAGKLRQDYARFLAEQNRPVEALHRLHEIVTENSRDLAAWRLGSQIALSRPEFLEVARDWTHEALQHFAEEDTIREARAEALLLSQESGRALELWELLWNNDRKPAARAALILCQLVENRTVEAPQNEAEAAAVTRAFVGWYRKCLAFGAHELIFNLNTHIEQMRPILPEAARILQAALSEAGPAPTETACRP